MYNTKYLNALTVMMRTSEKVEATILSCETLEQLEAARAMLALYASKAVLYASELYFDIFTFDHPIGRYRCYKAFDRDIALVIERLSAVFNEHREVLVRELQEAHDGAYPVVRGFAPPEDTENEM